MLCSTLIQILHWDSFWSFFMLQCSMPSLSSPCTSMNLLAPGLGCPLPDCIFCNSAHSSPYISRPFFPPSWHSSRFSHAWITYLSHNPFIFPRQGVQLQTQWLGSHLGSLHGQSHCSYHTACWWTRVPWQPTNLLRRFMPQAVQSSIAVLQHFHLIFAAWLIPHIVRLCCTSLLLLMIRQQWKCQSTSLCKGYDILDCWCEIQPGLWALLWLNNYEPNPKVQSCGMKVECCQCMTACMRGVQAVHGCQCAV